jgi:hypothetical protein
MEYIEKIKKMLCKELDEYAMKSKLSMADIDVIHKLTDTVKNLDKIEMLEDDGGYSETYPYYMGGSSYANRGRGRYAKRDSMGRYSSDMGSSYDDYSEARMDRRYSRDDAKDHMMNKLGEMMTSADEEQREILKDAMRKIERA